MTDIEIRLGMTLNEFVVRELRAWQGKSTRILCEPYGLRVTSQDGMFYFELNDEFENGGEFVLTAMTKFEKIEK